MTSKNCSEVVEIVIYKIKPDMDESYQIIELDIYRRLLEGFDGFISLETYKCYSESRRYIDLTKWESIEAARQANKQIEIRRKSPLYKNYLGAFELMNIVGCFTRIRA